MNRGLLEFLTWYCAALCVAAAFWAGQTWAAGNHPGGIATLVMAVVPGMLAIALARLVAHARHVARQRRRCDCTCCCKSARR